MSNFKEMVDRHTILKSGEIKKICLPLEQDLGITNFFYCKTSAEGRFITLASNAELHDYYHSNDLHSFSPFYRNPKFIQPGFYIYNTIKNPNFQDSLDRCEKKFLITFGGSLVIKKKDTLHRFGYIFQNRIGPSFT